MNIGSLYSLRSADLRDLSLPNSVKSGYEVNLLERRHYLYSGLRVTSEIRVPEWEVFETLQPFDQADVVVRTETQAPAGNFPEITAGLFCFHVPNVAYYVVKSGCEITVTPLPEAEHDNAHRGGSRIPKLDMPISG